VSPRRGDAQSAVTSIFDLLEHWAVVQPHKVLFEFRDRRGEASERHTYQSCHERTQVLAAHLVETPGLGPGDRVLLAYPPGLGGITTLLACARAGLIGVPVALPKAADDAAMRRLRTIAVDCGATALLSDGVHLHRLWQLMASNAAVVPWRLLNTDDFAGAPMHPARHRHDEVLFLQYTSGSTGQPRGVIVSHSNVIANAKATLDHRPIGVSWLPQHHDMGLIGCYLFPIVSGGTSYGFAPADFLRTPASWMGGVGRSDDAGARHSPLETVVASVDKPWRRVEIKEIMIVLGEHIARSSFPIR
jgi:acyl-CoA synthetase (AMP-forming)/AMP-acid ligase II